MLPGPRMSASARVKVPAPAPRSAQMPGPVATALARKSRASREFMPQVTVSLTRRCYGTDSDFGGRTHCRRNREAARARAGSWRVDRDDLVGHCGCVCGNVARPDARCVLERTERGLDRIDYRRRCALADLPRDSWTERFAAGLA